MPSVPARRASCAFGLVTVVFLATAPTAPAQIPEEFTNLQVLPEDISRGELIGVMRGFSMATGLRCSNCHEGEEGQPFSTYDFASDEPRLKNVAREMLRMVGDINRQYLAALPGNRGPAPTVSCVTCHSGVRRPQTIDAIVERLIREEGIDFAVSRYRDLREQYYGSAAYNFHQRPLINLAEPLVRSGSSEAAVRVLELNLEYIPESWQTMSTLGQVHDRAGDTETAIEWYRRSLEVQPRQPPIQRRLEELVGGAAEETPPGAARRVHFR